jgi:hypothetical protein
LSEDWQFVGASADVHGVWAYGVLRLFAEPACDEALSCDQAPDHAVDGAWGGLGLVLYRRGGSGREVAFLKENWFGLLFWL